MVVEADVPHPTKVSFPSEAEATTATEVTPETVIEAHTPHTADDASPTGHPMTSPYYSI